MGASRVLRTAAATLSHTFVVGETPTDSSTAVAVSVTNANGVVVASGAGTLAATGRYTFPLPPQAQLSALTVAWSATIAGALVVEGDQVEIVGGFFFTLTEGRASDTSLADTVKYPTDQLAIARQEVEEECEEICARAFVPRYRRVLLDGSGTRDLVLPDADIRTIRAVSTATQVGQVFTPLTAVQLAALATTSDKVLTRVDGNVWGGGLSNVLLEYEYGLDAPPLELKKAALLRFRSRLNLTRSGVPDRATSFTVTDGGTYRIDLPDAYKTGLPEVDAVYSRYSRRSGAGTGNNGRGVPASRPLNFDPQRGSLFHGGAR